MDKYRKKPIMVEAIQWNGGDFECLDRFCGHEWSRADVQEISFDDPEQVVVYNKEERQWLQVPVGHWIIRGLHGEYYPCSPDVFEKTYEAA